jgi:hypothetical protein
LVTAVLYWNKLAGIEVKEALLQPRNVLRKIFDPTHASNMPAGIAVNAVQPLKVEENVQAAVVLKTFVPIVATAEQPLKALVKFVTAVLYLKQSLGTAVILVHPANIEEKLFTPVLN